MPGYVLDTNVVSEVMKPTPDERVQRWLAGQSPADLYLSSIVIGELLRGILRLPAGRRRSRLLQWATRDLPGQFPNRILPYDHESAVVWGTIMGAADRRSRPRPAIDAQLAAITIRFGLTLATRNDRDFKDLGAPLLNPWHAG